MEINSKYRAKLLSQIKNSYGKVCYSLTCHEKEIHFLSYREKRIKILQIVLSAASTGSIISIFFGQGIIAQTIAGIVAMLLLILNAITLKFDLSSEIARHKDATNKLWLIREWYLKLITDFSELDNETIRNVRDELTMKTSEVYSFSPKTSAKAYKETQIALKHEEEQFFSEEELDKILPPYMRTVKSKTK